MASINRLEDGLDVTNADLTTPDEIDAFRAEYDRTNKGQLDSFEFWIEFRPDVLKRHKARSPHLWGDEADEYPLALQLLAIHQYTIERFRGGIGYEIRLAQFNGAQRTDILDTLSVAFLHSGHGGMYAARAEAAEYLRDYRDPQLSDRFPPNWGVDPDAFLSGMDFSNRDATGEDMDRLRDWYRGTIGEVPRSVEFLARHRPGLLKAQRNRYEHAIRDTLPAQMLPYMLLNYSVVRGDREGIRENVLLGLKLGMTQEQLLDSIGLSVLFAGLGPLALVNDVAGDLLGGTEDVA